MSLKKIKELYFKVPLVLQILIGLSLGIILAYTAPQDASFIKIFGSLFVNALKGTAPLLVLILVTSAIANSSNQKNGFSIILVMYCLSTFGAACIASFTCFEFPLTLKLDDVVASDMGTPHGVSEVLLNIITNAVGNPISALADANYIAILVWAIILGLAFKKVSKETKIVITDFANVITDIIKIIIRFAPLGVMGLVFSSCTAEGGFSNLMQYGKIIFLLVSTMALVLLILNPLIVYIVTKKNPYPLVWISLKDSAYYAFFTRSSAANIPVNIALCDRMNVPRNISALSIPLGATINMAGAAITISVLTLCTVFTVQGTGIDFFTAFILCCISSVCACGASGVAGGSLMLIPLACSIFNIDNNIAMQVVGIGMIIGVIQDSCETALNSSTDALFTIAISERNKRKALQKAD